MINVDNLPGPLRTVGRAYTTFYRNNKPPGALSSEEAFAAQKNNNQLYWVPAEKGYTLDIYKTEGFVCPEHWPYLFDNYWDAMAFWAALRKKIDNAK